ncbi:hypothetical protein ACWGJ2_36800 [Streptomyces sp. NPDC054796]
MRIRRALAAMAVGTSLMLGASAAPAFAASSDAATATVGSDRAAQEKEATDNAAATWHYWATYNTLTDCTVAGIMVVQSNPSRYQKAQCTPGTGTTYKLWILI